MKKTALTLLAVFMVAFGAGMAVHPAAAQLQPSPAPASAQAQTDAEKTAATKPKEPFDPNRYVEANFGTLMDAYMALKLRDPGEIKVLEEYVRYFSCPLYYQYQENDFAWKRLLQGVSMEIETFKDKYPTHIKLLSRVTLGAYDFNKNGFLFAPADLFTNAGMFELNQTSYYDDCRKSSTYFKVFPNYYILRADNPLQMENLPLEQKKSDALVRRLTVNGARRDITSVVYLRIAGDKITETRIVNDNLRSVISGHVDKIEFYEDPELTRLLYEKEF